MATTAQATREALARLLRAAGEDPAFRGELLLLLRTPAVQRRAMVNAALVAMAGNGEAADLRVAFSLLATDAGAAAMLRLLAEA